MTETTAASRCPPCYETRWEGSVAAIESVTRSAQAQIDFGLMMFPTVGALPGPDKVICQAGSVSVPVKASAAAAISDALRGVEPNGATPTAAALRAAKKTLVDEARGLPDLASAPGYVLLVTDGVPTCPVDAEPGPTYAALDALREAGVRTYVVGYGIDPKSEAGMTMGTMATRGGTPHFYPAEEQTELLAAFDEIASIIVSCDYALAQPPPRVDAFVRVRVDGGDVPRGADGWTRDAKTIHLEGATCEKLRNGGSHTLEIVVECEPVQVI